MVDDRTYGWDLASESNDPDRGRSRYSPEVRSVIPLALVRVLMLLRVLGGLGDGASGSFVGPVAGSVHEDLLARAGSTPSAWTIALTPIGRHCEEVGPESTFGSGQAMSAATAGTLTRAIPSAQRNSDLRQPTPLDSPLALAGVRHSCPRAEAVAMVRTTSVRRSLDLRVGGQQIFRVRAQADS
jgi:hypothetical protein